MAVDASQILLNRELGNFVEGNGSIHNSSIPIGYGMVQGPLSGGTTTATDGLIQMHHALMADSFVAKTYIKSESGLTYAVPIQRKRPRGEAAGVNNHKLLSFPPTFQNQQNVNQGSLPFTILGEDLSSHVQREQSEVDRFIVQHAQKVRMEIEEKKRMNSRRIIAAVENVVVKKLRSKQQEIEKISRVNSTLEDRVKSLYVENQIWRELAQRNEATANALRCNLEQILVQLQDDQKNAGAELGDNVNDAQSCCGSNCIEDYRHDSVAGNSSGGENGSGGGNGRINRLCRNCWKAEANVLIMPCRHLCLCHACGPLLFNCPICNSVKNAMLQLNMI